MVKSDRLSRVKIEFLATVKSRLARVSDWAPSFPFGRSAMTQYPWSIASWREKVDFTCPTIWRKRGSAVNAEVLLRIGSRMVAFRSEERRVGKEGRSRWSPDH